MEKIAKKISKKNKIAHRKLTPGTLLSPEEEILCIPEGQFPTKNNSYSTIYATPTSLPPNKVAKFIHTRDVHAALHTRLEPAL